MLGGIYMFPRCEECGRFMSWDDIIFSKRYTPYGGWNDEEPPDERFIHRRCYDTLTHSSKMLIDKTAWMKNL